MPYNILLLPLVAGFLLIARARVFCYATSQLQKEQLLLWASLAGLSLLLISRIICVLLADTTLGEILLEIKTAIAPFPYMGTAVGTLVIASLLVVASNCLIPESEAGLWVYHSGKFNQLESLLLSSAIGVPPAGRMGYWELLRQQLWLDVLRTRKRWSDFFFRKESVGVYSCFPAGDPKLVMVTLADNKVYVGLVSQLPPIVAVVIEYLRIMPVWSGYRDSADRRVYRTTTYEDALLNSNERDLLIKVVPTKDIAAVGIYVDGTFPIRDLPPPVDVESGTVPAKPKPSSPQKTKKTRKRAKKARRSPSGSVS